MLSDDEDDFAPAAPAPTTAPIPKASKKNLRKTKVIHSLASCQITTDLNRARTHSRDVEAGCSKQLHGAYRMKIRSAMYPMETAQVCRRA